MNFLILNIEKKISELFFQYFMFSSRYMLFPTFKNQIAVKQIPGGGGRTIFLFS